MGPYGGGGIVLGMCRCALAGRQGWQAARRTSKFVAAKQTPVALALTPFLLTPLFAMKSSPSSPKRAYHPPTLTKHGSVEELTLTYGHYDVDTLYGHIHGSGCGHTGMPGS